MSTSIHVKVGGSWKAVASYHVKVSGTWKEGTEIHAKVSSAWEGGSTSSGGGGSSGLVTVSDALTLEVMDFVMPSIGTIPAKSGITTGSLEHFDFVLPVIGQP